ncbi:glycosyltransferase [Sphaerisporangium aureirubrum]|uniref:Glycosyltransferase n=1 Tax=Sphaerisporangium aureirubrum TaxID=1544736 RepID=A0ABW1NSI4_9ACTN
MSPATPASAESPPSTASAPGELHVCEVVKTLNVGGVEVLLVERLSRAPRDGTRYTVVCLRASTGELIDRLRAAGVTVVDLSAGTRALGYARLVAAVRGLAPHVLNVHSPAPAIVLRPLLRLAPRRRPYLVSTVHYAYSPLPGLADRMLSSLVLLMDRLTRRLDDRTVAVSSQVARSPAVRHAPGLLTRVHGVDVAEQRRWAGRAAATRREFGVPDDAFLLVCVANFRPQKNHMMLVQAAAEVLAERPDAVFLLAGGGPLRERIAHLVRRRGLADRIRVLGPVSDARRLVAAADLLVLGSHYEGLPVVVMEALAAGVPVVSTRVGGVPELVVCGRNGVLTEPGSASALAAGMLRAMEPETHRALRSGVLTGAPAVDLRGTAEWFERLYRELAGAPRHA